MWCLDYKVLIFANFKIVIFDDPIVLPKSFFNKYSIQNGLEMSKYSIYISRPYMLTIQKYCWFQGNRVICTTDNSRIFTIIIHDCSQQVVSEFYSRFVFVINIYFSPSILIYHHFLSIESLA